METTQKEIIEKIEKKAQKRTAYSLFGTITLGIFIFFNFKYWIIPVLKNCFAKGEASLTIKENFEIFWVTVVGYILISLLVIVFVNIIKKVNDIEKSGLIFLLTEYFIFGFIINVVLGLTTLSMYLVLLIMALLLLAGIVLGLCEEFIK